MPALQREMQASSTPNFRYFTCLLDRGHIICGWMIILTVCAFSDRSSRVFSLRTAGRIVEFRVESIEVFAVEPVGHDS